MIMFSVFVMMMVIAGLDSTQSFDCPPGWFGSICQYKCRCLADKCGAVDGRCINGTWCQLGWFGPSCQYADLAQSETATTRGSRSLAVVTDGNEKTCLGALTKEISIRWAVSYQVTWLRIYVQDSYLLSQFSVKFRTDWNRQIPCKNMRTTKVSETAFDLHCDLNVTVTQVVVSWDGQTNVCSLYVSGGRNIALKQNTAQSSTDGRTFKPPVSSNAVDGDTSSDYTYGICAQTANGDPSPKWSVMLSRNFTVNRYRLFHRMDATDFLRRTYWFTLQGLAQDGTAVFTDPGSGSTFQNVYGVTTATSTAPIGRVSIQSAGNTRRFTAAPSVLSLCEVEVYGESICESGQFGRDCEQKCNCMDNNEPCLVSTGGCISGCSSGYHGEGCLEISVKPTLLITDHETQPVGCLACPPGSFGQSCKSTCSQLCLANSDNINLCDHVNGTCLLGCQIGFDGPWCNSTCTQGTYGRGCSYECSKLCVSDGNSSTPSCHHLHGVCLHGCQPGYKGLMCNQPCVPGRYGQDCNLTCSQFCLGDNNNISICDHTIGRCLLGCQSGYEGVWCNKTCSAGRYGTVCKSPCPEFCQPDTMSRPACHPVNGSCFLGCRSGYTGSTCDQPCKPGSFGQDCKAACPNSCAVDSVGTHSCQHISGVCLRGCEKGFQGAFCNKSCDRGSHGDECGTPCPQLCETTNIEEPVCHNVHGTCLQGCQVGYKGPTCNQTCDPGYFGQSCSFLCPQFCRVVTQSQPACHHVNGTCTQGCQPGFTGPMCEHACPPGTFGPYCILHCSQFCNHDNLSCDPVDGACLHGCRPGFMGPLCNEKCPTGKFGLACKFDCSQNCLRTVSSCSHVNGSCLLGCREGFEGHNCTNAITTDYSSTTPYIVWVVIVVCCGVVLVAVTVTFWRRRKQIKSRLTNIAIQVKIQKSSSTENIITTDVSEFGSKSF